MQRNHFLLTQLYGEIMEGVLGQVSASKQVDTRVVASCMAGMSVYAQVGIRATCTETQ